MEIRYPIRILMVFHSSQITGPAKATLNFLGYMNKDKYVVDVACPSGGDFVKCLAATGIRHLRLDFGYWQDMLTIIKLSKILRKDRYHILHGHMGRVSPIICLAGKIANVPAIILTEHMLDYSHSWISNNIFRLYLHRIFHIVSNNCLDRVIAVSEAARRSYIIRQGIDENKVATIYNCTDFRQDSDFVDESKNMALRESFGFTRDAIIIGMIGRLIREKGYQEVILIARDILGHNSRVRFLLVGDGPDRQRLECLARENNLSEKIFFTGFRQDTKDIIRSIDILVQPSWSESAESFGLVLIEAMANCKVVVASGVEPFKEIIEDGVNGLLFPEKNLKILRERLILLLDNRGLWQELAERGYHTVRERFNPQKIANMTGNLYETVLLTKGHKLQPLS